MKGLIVKAISGFYYIKTDNTVYECKARGFFRKSGLSPLTGDYAEFETLGNGKGVITKIEKRKNLLSRPPISNVDKAVIVSSYCTPAPNTLLIDTLVSICEYSGIIPVIVFNKSDLGDFSYWQNLYEKVGYKVVVTSAETGDGIDEIIAELKDNITVFTGNSGVGKSSIINRILPHLNLKTGEISEKLGRGRHTTRHTELFEINGGHIADTAGFSSIEADKTDYDYKESLADTFKEFREFSPLCRFTGCSHIGEKGCAVCKAVQDGIIASERHKSYVSLFNELKDLKRWETSKK